MALLLLYLSYTSSLPDPAGLADFRLDEGSRVVSADGVELASFAAERRDVVSLDDIPQVLIDAQVAAEDQSFWTNPCIDLRGILRAALQNFQAGERVSGASTICQQLVRIRLIDADLMADPTASWNGRSRRRSWRCGWATPIPERRASGRSSRCT